MPTLALYEGDRGVGGLLVADRVDQLAAFPHWDVTRMEEAGGA